MFYLILTSQSYNPEPVYRLLKGISKLVFSFFIIFIFNACCAAKSAEPVEANPPAAEIQNQNDGSGQILVRFKTGTYQDKIKDIQDKYGLEMVKSLKTQGLYLFRIKGKISIETIIKELKKHNEVMYVEPDHRYRINSK